jgi:hypothetical protein
MLDARRSGESANSAARSIFLRGFFLAAAFFFGALFVCAFFFCALFFGALLGAGFFLVTFLERFFAFVGVVFLRRVLFGFVGFFEDFFLAAIREV